MSNNPSGDLERVSVPREPTEAMIGAGAYCTVMDPGWTVSDIYRAMIAAAPAPSGEADFEVHQGDDMVAGCSGPRDRALAEARHYAFVYGQDGPVTVYEVTRTPVDLALLEPRQ